MSEQAYSTIASARGAQVRLFAAPATVPHLGVFVFAHGAGAGQAHPFMVDYASGLAARGLDVATFNFPYMETGRRAPDRAPVLEEAFRDVIAAVVEAQPSPRGDGRQTDLARRLFIGGKSMGGRMAVRLAGTPDAWPSTLPALAGVIVFGYPLNPPGGGKGDRTSHFAALTAPTLIVQGTRDSFGGPDDIAQAAPNVDVHPVPQGDHSFKAPKSAGTPQAIHASVLDAVIAWVKKV